MNLASVILAAHSSARLARRATALAAVFGATLGLFGQTARVNLAKYQLATASAQSLTYAYDPEFAADGIVSNFSSYRTGNVSSGWWLQLTYPQSVTIASAHVYLGQVGSTSTQILGTFKFQSSADGTTWTDIPGSSISGNTQVERSVIFSQAITARYFRLVGLASGSFTVRELAFFPPNVGGAGEQGYPLGTDVRFNLAYLRPATASSANVTNQYGPGYAKNAFDGYIDNASRWVLASNAAAGAWLEVELGELPRRPEAPATSTTTLPTPVYIGSAHVYSGFQDSNRVSTQALADFKLQSFDAATSTWVDIPGATITGNTNPALEITFTSPVTTSNVRLVTTSASPARLQELLLFPPSSVTSATALGREVVNATLPAYTFTGYNGSNLPLYANTWDTYSDSIYRLRNRGPDLRLGLVNGTVVYTAASVLAPADTEWQLLLNIRDGSYRIRHTATGLCLALASVTTAAGTAVVAQEYSALPHQDWFLVEDATDTATPKRFRLVNAYSGLTLQSLNNSWSAGTPAVVQPAVDGLLLQTWNVSLQRLHPKKGIAGTNNIISTSTDTTKRYSTSPTLTFHEDFYNRLGGNWSYSWGRQSSDTFPYLPRNFTFNPMQWGNGNNNFWVHSTVASGGQGPIERNLVDLQASAKPVHLMGYNEPDHDDQGDTTVAEAIARWPRLEAMQTPLVGPCPADPNGTWQNDFYAQANALGYRRDYTPVHWYAGPNASSLISVLQNIYNTYGRPIWLTEFSTVRWSGTATWTDADNFNFLAEFMWRAESLSWLKRYSVFVYIEGSGTITSGGIDIDPAAAPRSNTVRADGSLTAFGQLYAGWDGVTSIVNHRAYHLHNKGHYHRIRNSGTAAPSLLSPETADAGVQWFVTPVDPADIGTDLTNKKVRVISTRDGRPLSSNGTTVTLGTVGQTDTSVEWQATSFSNNYGWYYLDHPATSKRLKNNNGSFSLVANTTADDTVRWRLVGPAVADAVSAPTVTSTLTASATVGSAFAGYQITATDYAWSYSAANLPPGLSLNTSTGQITGTPTSAGTYAVTLNATNYVGTGSSATLTITVAKITPQLSWSAPAAITYGTALSGTQLNATSGGVPGTFTYNPAAGSIPNAGTQTLSVTFTPTDTASYNSATTSVSLTVNKATPALSWSAPAAITYGTALSGTQLNATAGGLSGTFAYSPAAGSVPNAGTQTLGVTFTPTDTANYHSATTSVALTVNKATPTLSWSGPAAITHGTALSGTQLNATSGGVPGTFTYSPAAGSTLNAGTQSLGVTFTPTNTSNYNSATSSVSLTVNKATPVLTWATPAAITYGTALSSTQLNATSGGVAGTFTYDPAVGAIPAIGPQTLGVTFTPSDAANYNSATASVSLTVNKPTPTLSWSTPAAITYGTALSSTQLNATSGGIPGTFTYNPAVGAVLDAGTRTLSVTFTPTDTAAYTDATATVSLTVDRATPTLSWSTPAPIVYETALSSTQLNATASLPGTFSYEPAAGSVLGVGAQTLGVTFTPTDSVNYQSVSTSVTLTVQPSQRVFLESLFSGVLGRMPTATDIAAYTAVINGGRSRLSVLNELLASQEFTNRYLPEVIRMYYAAFGRAPDYTGLLNWSNHIRLNGPAQHQQVAAAFVGSAEFTVRYGSPTDSEFIRQLYRNVLAREAAQSEVDSWVALLNGGMSRSSALFGFAESDEFKRRIADEVEVTQLYFVLFGRVPTALELRAGLGALRGHGQTSAFLGSAEFATLYPNGLSDAAFVELIFQGFLRRPADSAGSAAYVAALASGSLTRPEAVAALLESAEAANNVIPAARLYLAGLQRPPDSGGLSTWAGQLRSGVSFETMGTAFATSQEFLNRYGGLSNQAYVQALYRNVLGRDADSAGLTNWTAALDSNGATRGSLLLGFAYSQEAISLYATDVRSSLHYLTFLNRVPGTPELAGWYDYLTTLRNQFRQQMLSSAGFAP